MFPIALDLTRTAVLLVGQGALLAKRLSQLKEAGASHITVREGVLPSTEDIANHPVVMVVGLSREASEPLAAQARAAKKLVNVEDVSDLCDFYFTANVKRGDLLIAISTGGASPTLAKRVKDKIAALFGEEWSDRTQEIALKRKQWKAEGKTMPEIMQATDALLAEKGWL